METWGDIRLKARERHVLALAKAEGKRDAVSLVAAALANEDLEVHRNSAQLAGGVLGSLERESRLVQLASGQDPKEELVVIAHEIGHFVLHTDAHNEVTVTSASLGGDPTDSGAARVEGYSPKERKEVQADVFAGEFLCPSDWLRGELLGGGKKPSQVAVELGLPPKLVLHQAIRAMCLPPLRLPKPAPATAPIALDDSQRDAATWTNGPLLVDAGPGTGKTRTLVHRIGHVLETNGGARSAILALTFSNKAAEEMRTRLATTHFEAAIEMWVGTFHAFGKELVSKWAPRLNRTANVKILDDVGQLALLEANLSKLPLKHFQNLYEPAFELVPVLRAISRCKDELVTWQTYLAEAEKALQAATTAKEIEDAEKSVEIAQIYKVYQNSLELADAVDFGDLIMLSVQLLDQHEDVRADVHVRFRHILVDEYQDVNYASARLLRLLGAETTDVWVVADQRQSIYRFRGAQPENVARFSAEFSGQRLSLSTNYRSDATIVETFSAFTRHMSSDASATAAWKAFRGSVGGVTLTVAPDVNAEAVAIRDQIEAFKAGGITYEDQAILARSHLTLSRITNVLGRLGVPLLYLGDLFERTEVSDLLSLVSIDAEYGGFGILRVASFPEYAVPRDDVLRVIRWADASQISFVEALSRILEVPDVTDAGREGLQTLSSHLVGFGLHTTPWSMLTTYLFERSNYLRLLIAKNGNEVQQQLIAIYQLLKTAANYPISQEGSRRRFLDHVRRIESLNQDQPFRTIPSEASDFDAVRVMTMHGSKGLEFRAVHLPAIATRYMPASRQAVRCPPPPSLAHLALQPSDHDAEEECLFFVGLSRARDYLSLSRAERYTKQTVSASAFLAAITSKITTNHAGAVDVKDTAAELQPTEPKDIYEERELDTYLRCPARYRYEVLNGLRGGADGSPYLRFHRVVHRTMDWMEKRHASGHLPTIEEASANLKEMWETYGPRGSAFDSYYRGIADVMIASVQRLLAVETGTYDRDPWIVSVGSDKIRITPDRVLLLPTGEVKVQRLKTGRKSKSEGDQPIYALMRKGASERYPGRVIRVETYYPGRDEAVPVIASDDAKAMKKYSTAIDGIEAGRFSASPEQERYCPNCPAYFVCDGE